MPTPGDDQEWGSTATFRSRHTPDDDVATARGGLRNADVRYGARPPRRPQRRSLFGEWMRGFVRRYGWRAYALPVLAIVTVAALMTSEKVRRVATAAGGGHDAAAPSATAPPTAGNEIALKNDAAVGKVDQTVLKAAALPSGAAYSMKGAGTYRVLPGSTKAVGTGPLHTYTIEVENGVTGVDLARFQKVVDTTLDDPRSWSGHGVQVKRVASGTVDFHVTLTSALTIRKLCGYSIPVETSCFVPAGTNGSGVNRVALNVARWVRGSAAYVGDLSVYRLYMVNHEVGHALGHMHAHQCLPGGLAPVMMQQTFGLRSAATGALCEANPWPYPPNAKGAPGAEQPDTTKNDEYGLAD